jgi:hypothetical protein
MTATGMDSSNAFSDSVSVAYGTDLGTMFQGKVEDFLDTCGRAYRGKVQLIFFSPPFPLKRQKPYGNKQGSDYLRWLADLAPRLAELLTEDGSLVIEVGNAWDPGQPTMSLLPIRSLLTFAERGELHVCQLFVCNNPARLPSPAQWVTIERIRVKDSYTHVWWMGRSQRPATYQRMVLNPYSESMKQVLRRGSTNSGVRASGHVIGETSFLTNNGGAIPGNVFSFSNTRSGDPYRKYCRRRGLPVHPAPMPAQLAEWFIKFLTQEGDLVLDPFGGSNTTGAVAEQLRRRWVVVEPIGQYIEGSRGRFPQLHHGSE